MQKVAAADTKSNHDKMSLLVHQEAFLSKQDFVKSQASAGSAFLGKYVSIIVVDLIHPKKLDSRNSNLVEARFNSLPFY